MQRRWILFEKVGRLAEALASRVSVSRRGFLGRLGQGAMAAAGVLGGFLLSARQAWAQSSGGVVCCFYRVSRYPKKYYGYKDYKICQNAGTTCPPEYRGAPLWLQSTAAMCSKCLRL
jgi:hypothetical protein